MKRHLKGTIVLCTLAMFTGTGWAQQSRTRVDDGAFMKAAPVKASMDSLEKRADTFEDRFEDALNKSGYNGTHTEDALARWADMLEDEIDDMAEDFKENDHRQFIDHFENAMIVASAINRSMLRKDFAAAAESEWSAMRSDLNHIAKQLHRPVLPNMTIISIVVAGPANFAKPNVKQTLEQLEASTDRFEEKFRKSIQHSTANMTDRERIWNRWADYLEDTSDDMLEEYKETDARGFQEELERTLMVGEAINRIMLRSDLFADSELEWKNVRNQLNVIAGAFGYSTLTDLIHAR
jgi:cytochrome c556